MMKKKKKQTKRETHVSIPTCFVGGMKIWLIDEKKNLLLSFNMYIYTLVP